MSVVFRGATVRGERAEPRAWRGCRLRSASAETKASDEARRRGFGDDRRGRSRHEMPKRVKSDETASRTMSIMPTAAFIRPEKRNATFSDEAICAGLVGAANLKIAASTGGRGNRPYQKDEYRWAKKRRTLTRHEATRTKKYHTASLSLYNSCSFD